MSLLEIVIVIVIVCWLLGALVVPVGGSAIHLLLVLALVLVIVRLVQGRTVL
jgi:hypothetical protein